MGEQWSGHILVVSRHPLLDAVLRMGVLPEVNFLWRREGCALANQDLHHRLGHVIECADAGWIRQNQGFEFVTLQIWNEPGVADVLGKGMLKCACFRCSSRFRHPRRITREIMRQRIQINHHREPSVRRLVFLKPCLNIGQRVAKGVEKTAAWNSPTTAPVQAGKSGRIDKYTKGTQMRTKNF